MVVDNNRLMKKPSGTLLSQSQSSVGGKRSQSRLSDPWSDSGYHCSSDNSDTDSCSTSSSSSSEEEAEDFVVGDFSEVINDSFCDIFEDEIKYSEVLAQMETHENRSVPSTFGLKMQPFGYFSDHSIQPPFVKF